MKGALTLQKVDDHDPMPKYLQARQILTEAIRAGMLTPGAKLPSTKELGGLINVSLITAHKALEGLVEAGWLRREVGRGTFVRDDVDLVKRARTKLFVGLLLDREVSIDDYYHSTVINALRREAHADGNWVEFFFHDEFDLREKGGKDVGAICLHPPLEAQADVERLAQRYPTVILGGSYRDSAVPSIDCDNEAGARSAIEHLVTLGHRRIMLVCGPTALSNARDRVEGVESELDRRGLSLSPRDLIESPDTIALPEDIAGAIADRLRSDDRPTAIIASGFYLCLSTIQVVRGTGLKIPQDVSIVAFDDPASAPLLDPPLTTVRQPLEAMASQAFKALGRALSGKRRRASSTRLPTELIVRCSTAPPPE